GDVDVVGGPNLRQAGEGRRAGEPRALERVLGDVVRHDVSLRGEAAPAAADPACDPAAVSDPSTIRAAVLDRPGVPTRIEALELVPPGPGEVRVRMAAAGVCHSDLHVRDGDWDREGPIVMGHEGSAVVEAL